MFDSIMRAIGDLTKERVEIHMWNKNYIENDKINNEILFAVLGNCIGDDDTEATKLEDLPSEIGHKETQIVRWTTIKIHVDKERSYCPICIFVYKVIMAQ